MLRSLGLPKGDLPIQEIQHPASRFVPLYIPCFLALRALLVPPWSFTPSCGLKHFSGAMIPTSYHPPIPGTVQRPNDVPQYSSTHLAPLRQPRFVGSQNTRRVFCFLTLRTFVNLVKLCLHSLLGILDVHGVLGLIMNIIFVIARWGL